MVNKSIIAVIPARGGSKRIPKKNIVDFVGKPMIEWTIIAAKQSGIFQDIYVDTDDQEIADVAVESGAKVPFLREQYKDDISPVSSATVQFVKNLHTHSAVSSDYIFQLMANCPLRNAKDIQSFQKFLEEKDCSFLLSCFPYGFMNPWWAFKLNDGKANPIFPDALKKRSQDLEKLFCPTGAIWAAKTSELVREETFYGTGHQFFELNWKVGLDIDDYEDLELAKALKTNDLI